MVFPDNYLLLVNASIQDESPPQQCNGVRGVFSCCHFLNNWVQEILANLLHVIQLYHQILSYLFPIFFVTLRGKSCDSPA